MTFNVALFDKIIAHYKTVPMVPDWGYDNCICSVVPALTGSPEAIGPSHIAKLLGIPETASHNLVGGRGLSYFPATGSEVASWLEGCKVDLIAAYGA